MEKIFNEITTVLGKNKESTPENEAKFNRIVRHLLLRLWDVYEKDTEVFSHYYEAEQFLRGIDSYTFTINKPDCYTYELHIEKRYSSPFYGADVDDKLVVPIELLDDDWEDAIDNIIRERQRTELTKEIEEIKRYMKNAPGRLSELEFKLTALAPLDRQQ